MKEIIIITENGATAKIPLSNFMKLINGEKENIEITDENGWKWKISLR